MSLEEILSDHAYCEQKAAISCISLIQYYSDKKELVDELSPVVTEEWGHFRLVLQELRKRNLLLSRQRKDEYVNSLLRFRVTGGNEEGRLLDQLLLMALVEARSCERFKRLSEGLEDAYLRQWYRRFMKVKPAIMLCLFILPNCILIKKKCAGAGSNGLIMKRKSSVC